MHQYCKCGQIHYDHKVILSALEGIVYSVEADYIAHVVCRLQNCSLVTLPDRVTSTQSEERERQFKRETLMHVFLTEMNWLSWKGLWIR